MTKKTSIETTVTVELTAGDILQYVKDKKIVPDDWVFFSVQVTGKAVSEGATLVIKKTVNHDGP